MIHWTISGVLYWLSVRRPLLDFYVVLGMIFFVYQKIFKGGIFRKVIYTFSFISFVVGAWELPLFLLGSQPWLPIWIASLVVYMVPFPVVCLLFKIRFSFSKKSISLFSALFCVSVISNEVCALTSYTSQLWDDGFSFIFRFLTFVLLFLIFRRIKLV